ncbi:sugar ABC transporter permease, partial [Ochrobactrum sp. SFR4]|uniref:carbohydrate ABC transporter permease n=1 Tax=Ochrobactrum sp. SFR4 TaxID=2717368 RepID=UPI002570486B
AARKREERLAWKLMAPAVSLVVLFILLPTLAVLYLSFTNFELGYTDYEFIGLENYIELFKDRTFRISLQNTAVYTLIVTPVSVFLGLGAALLIESETRGKAFFRTVYFLPVASLLVAMATVWQYLLHPTMGPVNAMLGLLGVDGPNWLGSSSTVLPSLAMIGIWQSV